LLNLPHAYQQTIFETVKNGYVVVVDLGTGTGIFAFFACQAGAKRVYAIEKDK
jgi:predicted RNA methylase